MGADICRLLEGKAKRYPWAFGCREFSCREESGLYIVEGDCGDKVLAVFTREGRSVESEPLHLTSLLRGEVRGLSVECLSPPPSIVAVEQASSGPRGEVYEALAPPYGRLHVKVFRRLPGHPRESLFLAYLSRKGFPLAPRLLCSVKSGGSDYVLVSESVEGEPLAHVFVDAAAKSMQGELVVPPESHYLGEAVAYLHRAALDCGEDWCRPRRAESSDVESWLGRLKYRASRLRKAAGSAAGDDRLLISEAADALEGLWEAFSKEAREALKGRPLIAVHGDLHLYQVFRGPGGRLIITDFEGEPSREPADPMELEPPERDLAALARSLDYARALAYMAARGSDAWEAARESKKALSGWLERVVKAVLSAYRDAGGPGALGFSAAFWVAERASYEALYELTYSTGLHPIPLEAIIRIWEGSDDVARALGSL